jgi:hypothetical protein
MHRVGCMPAALPGTAVPIDIGNTWWIRSTPGAVIGRIGPKLTSLGTATAGIEYGRGGFVREHSCAPMRGQRPRRFTGGLTR